MKHHKEDNVEDRETGWTWTSKRGMKEEQRDSTAVPQISQMAVFAGTKHIIQNVETNKPQYPQSTIKCRYHLHTEADN